MSLGGNRAQKGIDSRTRPADFRFGPLGAAVKATNNGKDFWYNPGQLAGEIDTYNAAKQGLSSLIPKMGQGLDINQAYDNPFYSTVSGFLNRAIDQQYGIDNKALQDKIAARNQLGSSYDAYSNYLQGVRFDKLRQDAQDQARQYAFNAYLSNQDMQNQAAQLLGSLGTNALNNYFMPWQLAQGYQQAINPLATASISGLAGRQANSGLGQSLGQLIKLSDSIGQAAAGGGKS